MEFKEALKRVTFPLWLHNLAQLGTYFICVGLPCQIDKIISILNLSERQAQHLQEHAL